ncbi:MAG: YCF48-related protein, partial [Ignavibacteriaceae bacterium]|nr:YCF48-related protein [Ignavibacteriaceae bacterium]
TNYNKYINAIGSYTGEKIIAAGDSGLIIISTDYGETWETIQSGTDKNFWNIQFVTEKIGWLVGEGSSAFKTTDSGDTWINQPTPLSGYPYWDVSFLDTSFGYICTNSGLILRTLDGGFSWDVKQAGDNYGLYTVNAVTRMKATAIGFAGKHVYTSDGGENWEFITYLGDESYKIVFLDTLKGFATNIVNGYETTDGGRDWIVRYDMNRGNNITFTNDENGFIVGNDLILEKTTNTGQSWNGAIINDDFTDVFFTDENNGWFIGLGRNDLPELFQTTDGGITLIQRNDFPGVKPSSVYFLDSLNGIIGAQNKIFKSYDGGSTWEEKNISGITGNSGEYNKLFFVNYDIGWALSYGYAVKTTDGGETWQSKLNTVALYGIHFSDSLNGWVARGIKPYKTTDGGETWVEQTNFPVSGARDVFFIDRFKGFICRTNELYKSVDAGINWSLVAEVTNFAFGRFSNLSANLFLAGGPRSYQSTDSGENWTEVVELRNKLVEFIRLSNVNEGFAVGWRGLILQYTDSVVSVRENNINVPAKYYLYQNYPNPFNPSTKIKYTVPSVTLRQAQSDINVTLKVYDILGKEITTLVNEEKPAGTYEVEFNSHSGEVRNLPSGVYFYRLKAGAYIETKKMVLLK